MACNFNPSTLEKRQQTSLHDVSMRPAWFTQAVLHQLGLSWDMQSQKTKATWQMMRDSSTMSTTKVTTARKSLIVGKSNLWNAFQFVKGV